MCCLNLMILRNYIISTNKKVVKYEAYNDTMLLYIKIKTSKFITDLFGTRRGLQG